MRVDWGHAGFVCTATLMAGALWVASAGIQAAPQQTAPPEAPVRMSEEVFLNVQVLKGIPADEFLDTMGMFASSLLYDCVSCHSKGILSDSKAFAEVTPEIQKARSMIRMMNAINDQHFDGEKRVTCFTCHGGGNKPKTEPNLDLQYGELVEEKYAMDFVPGFYAPSVDDTFAKYIKALGGAGALAKLTNYTATGTFADYSTDLTTIPVEIYARSPNQSKIIAKARAGDTIMTFDGRSGWREQPDTPVPLLMMTGGNLVGWNIEAMVRFPAGIQKAFEDWQVATTTIDDRDTVVMQGSNPDQTPVRLFFDAESGLLVRVMHWNTTAVGSIPTKLDLGDYRAVNGVQVPFLWTKTWTDNQIVIQMKEVRPNVAMDAARFARPR